MNSVNHPAKENWKKNILLFLSSQTISLFGSSLVQYAMMWHITLTTQSGVMMTMFILCGFFPTFILSPIAGGMGGSQQPKNADYFIRCTDCNSDSNTSHSIYNGI